MAVVAGRLWSTSGLRPQDIQTAFLYDHFTPFVLVQLEELGFCARGEAKDFATIENLSIGGSLPINTSGGLLGEAYIHRINGITEAVRQIRGTSCNQVAEGVAAVVALLAVVIAAQPAAFHNAVGAVRHSGRGELVAWSHPWGAIGCPRHRQRDERSSDADEVAGARSSWSGRRSQSWAATIRPSPSSGRWASPTTSRPTRW